MKRGSTTPITITIDGIDLTGAEWLIISVKRAGSRSLLELSGDRLSVAYADGATTIAFQLTQAESLASGSSIGLDVNWMLDGVREGCVPQGVSLTDTYLNREVE